MNYSPITDHYDPKFKFKTLDGKRDTSYLDKLLLDGDLVRPVHVSQLADVPQHDLSLWCLKHGVYAVPTWELIHWLQRELRGRRAIEICAGRSCLGRHLGIPMTDSYSHVRPEVMIYMAAFGQHPTIPSDDVLRIDANAAVREFRPEVVIGAWVSQKRTGNEEQANEYGPDEFEILDSGCTYIHVGHLGPHSKKRILLREHRCLNFTWLRSRGFDPAGNRIWIWDHSTGI
jgi:hypothetical protein